MVQLLRVCVRKKLCPFLFNPFSLGGFLFSHYCDPDIVVKLHELIGEIEFFSSKYLQTAILHR